MARSLQWTVVALLGSALVGCYRDRPLLRPAGTLQQQRLDATIFDPYADVETGPEIVGGRPRDFGKPLTESDRSRLFRSRWLPF